jgi:hypothetical protein
LFRKRHNTAPWSGDQADMADKRAAQLIGQAQLPPTISNFTFAVVLMRFGV